MDIIKKYKFDIILIICLVIAGAAVFLYNLLFSDAGKTVTVRVSGKEVAAFSLDNNTVYEIRGKDDGVNVLRIEDGAAWIEDASCRDKLCVGTGKIRYAGQSVICLPNEVVVEINGSDENGVDVKAG